ncbi:hypothetical protein ES703_37077 [subsurface metagenome]
MTLVSNFPGKVRFMQYNTGGLGEIIEIHEENGQKKKRQVRKVKRVPINLMAQIQRGDLRGTNQYERGILGTKEIKVCEGQRLNEYDIHNFYSEEQIQRYIQDLVKGRRAYTEEIASEGLREEILYASERSFRIDKSEKKEQISVPGQAAEDKPPTHWEFKSRPKRGRFWRSK